MSNLDQIAQHEYDVNGILEEFILVRRSDLPEVTRDVVDGICSSPEWQEATDDLSPKSPELWERYAALYLAKAEFLRAEQEREDTEALDREADQLRRAAHPDTVCEWHEYSTMTQDYWRRAALKAREIHAPKEAGK